MQEKDHILDVLKQARVAIKQKDVLKLKALSDQTTHMISIYKDTDSLSIAVIIYAIGKIIEKEATQKVGGCTQFCNHSLVFLDKAAEALKKNNNALFRESLESIVASIKNLSPKLKLYITDIFTKAKINKASKIHEHGISLEQTAKLFGITSWDIASYSAQNPARDQSIPKTVDPLTRIKIAEEIFT